MSLPAETPSARWCVAANIVRERRYGPLGLEKKAGTKHFRPGAKVWVIDWFPGMCCDVVVVGTHRGSRRFVKMVVDVVTTEGWRPQRVYRPTVLALLEEHFEGRARLVTTEEDAKDMCHALVAWAESRRPKAV